MSAEMYAIIRNPLGPSQTVAFTGTAGTVGKALPPQAQSVLVVCTTTAYVRISFGAAGVAATATDIPIVGNVPYVLPIQRPTSPGTDPTCWVSAIQFAAGGSLIVQPLSE